MSGFTQSRFAARLQNAVSKRREAFGLYKEIAHKIQLGERGCVLDVGTGSGLQLKVIHEMRPRLELSGIDPSEEAIKVARGNLAGIEVDLRIETIQATTFENDQFDIVTCHSSMSYWSNLILCFDEIFRILKPGGIAVLFEPRKNIDIEAALAIIRRKLSKENRLRRFAVVNLNRFGLRWGHRLGLNLYAMEEVEGIVRRSRFADRVTVIPESLQEIPIFMKISLSKT